METLEEGAPETLAHFTTIGNVAAIVGLILAATTASFSIQDSLGFPEKPPSMLEDFLTQTPDLRVQDQRLGEMNCEKSKARATFTAIVARANQPSDGKVKGIRIVLEDEKRKLTIYLDDDNEEGITQGSLESFENDLRRIVNYPNDHRNAGCPTGTTLTCNETPPPNVSVSCENRISAKQGEYLPRFTVLDVGWSRIDEHFAVRMSSPGPAGGTFYFSGAKISQLLGIVSRGRAYLNAH